MRQLPCNIQAGFVTEHEVGVIIGNWLRYKIVDQRLNPESSVTRLAYGLSENPGRIRKSVLQSECSDRQLLEFRFQLPLLLFA